MNSGATGPGADSNAREGTDHMTHHTHGQTGTGNADGGDGVQVLDNAVLADTASATGGVLLSRRARVADQARLDGAVEVTDDGVVDGSASVTGTVRIDGKAHVGGQVAIEGEDIHLGDDAEALENVQIKGQAIEIINRAKLDGDLRIGSGAQILHSAHAYRWDGHHDGHWTVFRNHRGGASAVRDGSWDVVGDVEHSDDAPHELKRYAKERGWE